MSNKKVLIALYGNLNLNHQFKLNDKVLLRRISLINNEQNLFKFNWQSRSTCPYNWVIELDYSYHEDNQSEPYPASLINNLYIDYGLRVYYKNAIGIAAIVIDLSNPDIYRISNNENSHKSEPFTTDISFEFFWKRYKLAYNKKPATYEYFVRALEYPNSIKSILFCASLESLFVPEGERNKKRDFVLQGLTIVGLNDSDQEIIGELFTFRNVYIHADKKGQSMLYSSSKFLSPWWEKCEHIIRKILFKHIELPW